MVSWEKAVSLTVFLIFTLCQVYWLTSFLCKHISNSQSLCRNKMSAIIYMSTFLFTAGFFIFSRGVVKIFFFFFSFHLSCCPMSLEKVCGQFFRPVTTWAQDSWSSCAPFPGSLNLDPSELFGSYWRFVSR